MGAHGRWSDAGGGTAIVLLMRRGDPTAETMKVAAEIGAITIFVSDDVSRYARRRHHQLSILCAHQRVRLVTFPGATVVPPAGLMPAGSDHYRVFTPYWKRWRSFAWRPPVASPRRVRVPPGLAPGSLSPPGREGQTSALLPPGGETEARGRAHDWLHVGLAGYEVGHDDLAAEGTSRLSPYLHFGCLSPSQLAHDAVGRGGAEPFLRQLCWRDFHHQVLAAFPDLPNADYRPRRRQRRHDPDGLQAWRSGLTGIPIVDARMRQLRWGGWMHNRSRRHPPQPALQPAAPGPPLRPRRRLRPSLCHRAGRCSRTGLARALETRVPHPRVEGLSGSHRRPVYPT